MTKQRVILSTYLIYFVFALLMHSLLITIQQSIYVYAIDTSKAFILLIMNYIGVLLAPVFFTKILSQIKYKRLSVFLLALVGFLCIFMPFTTNLDFPKFMAVLIGFTYSCVRISSYVVLKTITQEESLYVSLVNRLDAIFALGFVFTWLAFGVLVFFNISWLAFYWLICVLVLFSVLFFVYTKFEVSEETNSIFIRTPQQSLVALFAQVKDTKGIFERTITFFKDVLDNVLSMSRLFHYSMVIMFSLCVALISMIQMHFAKYIPYLSTLFNNIPSMSMYLMMMTFFAIFLGRFLASFIIPIFSPIVVLIASLCMLSVLVVSLSFQTDSFVGMGGISQFSELPTAFWLVPVLGFAWSPVMPTLCALVFHHVNTKQAYQMAGIIVFIIFSVEAASDGTSASLFEQFNLNIALILSLIPIILLLITSILFLNDLKNKDGSIGITAPTQPSSKGKEMQEITLNTPIK
jgi:MFS family permease